MSETSTLWLFGTIIGVLTTVIGGMAVWIISHSRDCRDFRVATAASLAAILAKLERMQQDIGDHDSGMRGDVHQLRNMVNPVVLYYQMEMERRK